MSNNIDFISVNTGGHNTLNSHKEVLINIPHKVTGDIKEEKLEEVKPIVGAAKASPKFVKIEKIENDEPSPEDQKKIIAENTTKIDNAN